MEISYLVFNIHDIAVMQLVLLNTPVCILIRSMFMRFKVNVGATGEKIL